MTAAKPAPGQGPKLTVVDNAHAVSPGQRLARARAQRNLSLEEVAKQLNLAVSMVRAIESDNFKTLPGHAFVKGYLRNYGKLVGLSPDELVKAYEILHGSAQESALAPPPAAKAPRAARLIAPLIKGVGYLIVLAIIAGVLGVVYQNFGFIADKTMQVVGSFKGGDTVAEPVPVAEIAAPVVSEQTVSDQTIRLAIPLHPVGTSSSAPAATVVPATTTPAVTADSPVATPTAEPAPTTPSVPPQSSLATDLSRQAVAVTAISPVPVKPELTAVDQTNGAGNVAVQVSSGEPVAADMPAPSEVSGGDGQAVVNLSFTGKSWVNVRDAKGKILFNGIKTAGDDVQRQGIPPIKVIIGNAPVVKISFNGKPFDFEYSRQSSVARLTLGDE